MFSFRNADKAVIISDLADFFAPSDNISEKRVVDKWNTEKYETTEFAGSAVFSFCDSRPKPISGNPKLKGWYAIFVAQSFLANQYFCMKLTSDKAYTRFGTPSGEHLAARYSFSENFWKCADMTGQEITLKKYTSGLLQNATVAYFKLIPLDEDEVRSYLDFVSNEGTKTLYATNDMYSQMFTCGGEDSFLDLVEEYKNSDVEWLSIENIGFLTGELCEDASFPRVYEKYFEQNRKYFDLSKITDISAYGHEIGLKICGSLRMGAWCSEFPHDRMCFDQKIKNKLEHCHCVDRNGDRCEMLSYAYPEVQEYIMSIFLEMLPCGVDAVEMIFSRGIPYVLFEQPVRERFNKKYSGVDMRTLSVEDSRVLDIHCEIMTEFVRRLRKAMDERCKELGRSPCRLHLRSLFSVYDSQSVGIDLEALSKERLIDAVISYPFSVHEIVPPEVFTDSTATVIDLDKYREYIKTTNKNMSFKTSDDEFIYAPASPDGSRRGPASLKERVAQFDECCGKYGVEMYYDILPRSMSKEEHIRRAKDLYEAGAERIALWDTYSRVSIKDEWTVAGFLGHKDGLDDVLKGSMRLNSTVKQLSFAGKNLGIYRPSWGY